MKEVRRWNKIAFINTYTCTHEISPNLMKIALSKHNINYHIIGISKRIMFFFFIKQRCLQRNLEICTFKETVLIILLGDCDINNNGTIFIWNTLLKLELKVSVKYYKPNDNKTYMIK